GFFKDERADVIIFGHSHSPLNEKIGNTLYFNPGSATDKIFAPYNSYGVIEVNESGIKAKIVRI
ncbi:MAG TPA: metallophosphoesterase family protein, partial [Candidatus Margulisiibacteriota bacterium]|nr:metallophosphoesterase family protein [Candidatus Margulisiibacteriota bacterium]